MRQGGKLRGLNRDAAKGDVAARKALTPDPSPKGRGGKASFPRKRKSSLASVSGRTAKGGRSQSPAGEKVVLRLQWVAGSRPAATVPNSHRKPSFLGRSGGGHRLRGNEAGGDAAMSSLRGQPGSQPRRRNPQKFGLIRVYNLKNLGASSAPLVQLAEHRGRAPGQGAPAAAINFSSQWEFES